MTTNVLCIVVMLRNHLLFDDAQKDIDMEDAKAESGPLKVDLAREKMCCLSCSNGSFPSWPKELYEI